MVTRTELIESIAPAAAASFSDDGFQGPSVVLDKPLPTRGGPGGMG